MVVSYLNAKNAPILLYNTYNDTCLNLQLATSSNWSYNTAVDASGRLVSISNYAIDIFTNDF